MKTKRKIRVIIADDHDLYIDGLTMLLKASTTIQLVAAAKNGKQLIELSKQYDPDVILTDLRMPVLDGITAIMMISELPGAPRIIALSTYDNDRQITEAMEAGASGYITKNAEPGEIIKAITAVYNGYLYCCLSTSKQLAIALAKSPANPAKIALQQTYSTREKEIIRLIIQEKTNKEIAAILFMAERTLEGVRAKLMEKMRVNTAIGLTIYAVKNGLYNIEDLR